MFEGSIMDPRTELKAGVAVLDPILSSAGFAFQFETEGLSSGGRSCSGAFIRGDRRLELHFQYSLGLVTYNVSNCSLSHEDYLRAQGAKGQYPGFSDEPIDAFKHLREDLKKWGAAFLTAPNERFVQLAQWVLANPKKKGFWALGK
jgi:hypothetical protein